MCLCVRVRRCQGLDHAGLSASVDKEQMATLTGQKTSSSHILVFYSAFTSILPMAAWHVWQGQLRFILECTVMYKKKGNKSVCSVVHAISFHEVIKQVMGTRQSWPPITWKDLNDPFAMITEWIVLLETLIKVKWWWAQTSTGLIYKYTFIIPSEWHKFRIILAIALWVFYRHKGSKNKQIIIK